MPNQELFDSIVAKRGNHCELCHWNIPTELHHCIVHRKKGHSELDTAENCELLCRECHSMGEVNSYEHRRGFWRRQVERGIDMKSWYTSLNLKAPENFE